MVRLIWTGWLPNRYNVQLIIYFLLLKKLMNPFKSWAKVDENSTINVLKLLEMSGEKGNNLLRKWSLVSQNFISKFSDS